jgi:tetratricopeptide (TPR) repeat protein
MVIESNLLLSYIQALSDTKKAEEILKGIEPGDKWREAYTKWNEVLGSLNDDELFNAAKLGKEYVDRGYPYLAIALLEPKLSKMEEYADGLYILGKAYYENGDYRKSIDVLQDISTLGDLNQYIYWYLQEIIISLMI